MLLVVSKTKTMSTFLSVRQSRYFSRSALPSEDARGRTRTARIAKIMSF